MNKWQHILGVAALVVFASLASKAQTADCPSHLVCISPEAARKALQDSDTVQAQKTELASKDQAIEDLRKELNSIRIELAKATGEKTGSEQMVVRLTAIIDILVKSTRKKSIGLIAF